MRNRFGVQNLMKFPYIPFILLFKAVDGCCCRLWIAIHYVAIHIHFVEAEGYIHLDMHNGIMNFNSGGTKLSEFALEKINIFS